MICAVLRVCLVPGLEPYERPCGCSPPWMLAGTGRADHSFGAVQGLAAGPGGAVQRSGGIGGRPGLILLSVQAGRLRTHLQECSLLAAGRWVGSATRRGGGGG